LLNIIGNAIKFSLVGPIRVQMEWEKSKGLKFLVQDRGRGLSPEGAKNLFEPFVQADNSMTRKFGGTGLGLAIARKFARALGDDVKLEESKLGEGSIFSIVIDAGLVDENKMIHSLDSMFAHNDAPPHPSTTGKSLKDISVLLVEDSIDNQFLIRH